MKYLSLLSLFLFILVSGCGTVSKVTTFNKSNEIKQLFGQDSLLSMIPPAAKVDSIVVNSHLKKFDIYFNKNFSYIPFRSENVEEIYSDVKNFYGKDFADYSFSIHTINKNIEELIPNFYRDKSDYDKSMLPLKSNRPKPIIKNISKPYKPIDGLIDRNILLWPSHGWYYNNRKHRWMWQRARLFQTIEDLGPYSFVIPYLIPMLENAGANVFVPRERDIQTNEAIIDDMSENYYETGTTVWRNGEGPGFAIGSPPYESGVNPFKLGKYRITNSGNKETAEAAWVPEIPAAGEYAVYISYNSSENNVEDAHYTVNHLGGSTQFLVNQKIGGGTWIFLGKFKFKKGKDRQTGKCYSFK